MAFFLFGFGLFLLFAGGELLVRCGVGLSRLFRLSQPTIGLIVIAAGTSAPEFVVTLRAALDGTTGLAAGNIIGSNISNVLLILGIGAMLCPLPTSPVLVFRNGGVMTAAAAVLAVMAQGGDIDRIEGAVLFAAFAAFVASSLVLDWRRPGPYSLFEGRAATRRSAAGHPLLMAIFLAVGVLFLYLGSNLVVDGAVVIARVTGVSEGVLGLTLVAVGTSLPELATTLVALARGQSGLAAGNIIGSNIFNSLGILGLTALIRPVGVPPAMAHADAPLMLGAAVLLLPLLNSGWRLSRSEGTLLFVCYLGYLLFLGSREGVLF